MNAVNVLRNQLTMFCVVCKESFDLGADFGKHFLTIRHILHQFQVDIEPVDDKLEKLLVTFDQQQIWNLCKSFKFDGLSFGELSSLEEELRELNFISKIREYRDRGDVSMESDVTTTCDKCFASYDPNKLYVHIISREHMRKEIEYHASDCAKFVEVKNMRPSACSTGSESVSTAQSVPFNSESSVAVTDHTMEEARRGQRLFAPRQPIEQSTSQNQAKEKSQARPAANPHEAERKYDEKLRTTVFGCIVCGVKTVSKKAFDQHVGSKGHMKRARNLEDTAQKELANKFCDLCQVNITGSENIIKHDQGKKHKKNEENLRRLNNPEYSAELSSFRRTVPNSVEPNGLIFDVPMRESERSSRMSEETSSRQSESGKLFGSCSKCDPEISFTTEESGELSEHIANHSEGNWEIKMRSVQGTGGERLLRCPVCKTKSFNGAKTFNAHLRSAVHIKNMTKDSGVFCIVCDINFRNESEYNNHMLVDELVKPQHDRIITTLVERVKPETKRGKKLMIECDVCRVSIDGLKNFKSHLEGSTHKRIQSTFSGNIEQIECRVCKNKVRYSDFTQHMLDDIRDDRLLSVLPVSAGVEFRHQ